MSDKPTSGSNKQNFFQIKHERGFIKGSIKYFIAVYALIVICIILIRITKG